MKAATFLQLAIIGGGLIFGAYFSKKATQLHEQMEHDIPVEHNAMDHGLLDISNDTLIPEITDLVITKDAMSGWNIFIKTTNFRFAPEQVNQENQSGIGHAHLYINGAKFARVYAPVFHIPELIGEGHKIKVTLNANGHETLAIKGVAIEREGELK